MDTKTQKISQNREKKQVIVGELSEKVNKAKAMVFTNYQGMTHHQIEGLKKTLKGIEAEFVITKNTLVKRALSDAKHDVEKGTFDQPTATLFAYNDPVAPLKELSKLIKALNLPTIKFGIFEGKVVSDSDVVKLSTLPSREVLIAKVVGGMKSLLYGLHRALNWNLQKLVLTLKAVEKSKGA
jgi:large subunit ribosomal protein L10